MRKLTAISPFINKFVTVNECLFETRLKVEPQRKLDLPVCAESHGALHRLPKQTESSSGGRLCEGLSGLDPRTQHPRISGSVERH